VITSPDSIWVTIVQNTIDRTSQCELYSIFRSSTKEFQIVWALYNQINQTIWNKIITQILESNKMHVKISQKSHENYKNNQICRIVETMTQLQPKEENCNQTIAHSDE
jgi:hypothetical protein